MFVGFSKPHIIISAVSKLAATKHGKPRRSWFPRLQVPFAAATPGTWRRRTKQLLLPVSFCARAARLAVIISVSVWHTKMRDSGEGHVHPLTLCPNGDSAVIATFAHKFVSSNVTPFMSH